MIVSFGEGQLGAAVEAAELHAAPKLQKNGVTFTSRQLTPATPLPVAACAVVVAPAWADNGQERTFGETIPSGGFAIAVVLLLPPRRD